MHETPVGQLTLIVFCFGDMHGRINGHPGGYVRIAGKWRLEEVKHELFSPPRLRSGLC